jgi:hypothetical protein
LLFLAALAVAVAALAEENLVLCQVVAGGLVSGSW